MKQSIKIRIIKTFSNTKIDSLKEYNTIVSLTNFYSLCYYTGHIEIMDKKKNAEDTMATFQLFLNYINTYALERNGLVGEWFSEATYVIEDTIETLSLFLKTGDIQFYQNAFQKLVFYCQKNEGNYNEWKEETFKYQKGKKRLHGYVAILIFLLSLEGLMFFSKVKKEKNNYSTMQEEQIDFEDYSFDEEEIDADMILKRKF